jgi:peroxiredoxin
MFHTLSRRLVLGVSAGLFALASTATFVAATDDPPLAKVGEKAPDFRLRDLDGKEHALSDYLKNGKVVVLEWFNPQCPYVVKNHQTFHTMKDTFDAYKDRNVVWLAINSGHAADASAAPDLNARMKARWEIEYPLLRDTSGEVGKAYRARTTPHMYVIDSSGILVYAGAIDDNSSGHEQGKTNYVRDALEAVLAGQTVAVSETRPYGCSVKYAR